MWAEHFRDPALMANRDAITTQRKLARVVDRLPLSESSRVLDVGPGDGHLFRLVAGRVARCVGVDPNPQVVRRLTELFEGVRSVEFLVGDAGHLPCAVGEFDVVVINSVLQALPTEADVEKALAELVRVCVPGGTIFVGELPFCDETSRGILPHLVRKLREAGPVNFGRLLLHVYVIPLVRGEPIVLYPVRQTPIRRDELEAMCEGHALRVECWRHRELRRPSFTRNDYRLHVQDGARH